MSFAPWIAAQTQVAVEAFAAQAVREQTIKENIMNKPFSGFSGIEINRGRQTDSAVASNIVTTLSVIAKDIQDVGDNAQDISCNAIIGHNDSFLRGGRW